jgi:hypothetical protein
MLIMVLFIGALYVVGLALMLPILWRLPGAQSDDVRAEQGGD